MILLNSKAYYVHHCLNHGDTITCSRLHSSSEPRLVQRLRLSPPWLGSAATTELTLATDFGADCKAER